MRRLRALSFLFLIVPFLASGRNTETGEGGEGLIQGVVLDDIGNPLPRAKVHAELKDVAMAKKIRFVESDQNGFFVIDRLDFGTYYVEAMKEDDGYGGMSWSFSNDKPLPTVQISAQTRIADVVVSLGPKAGILTGTIRDAVTGKPISAGFDLVQVKDHTKWMGAGTAPDFRVLIPSSKDMEVKVSAPGYDTWVNPGPNLAPKPLRMEPGSEAHLDILLNPTHDTNLPISKFVIPDGYVGWLRVEHDVECASPVPVESGTTIFRFTGTNVLETSSPMPETAAERRYFYYSTGGSERDLAADYRNGNGMIWRETPGSRDGRMRMFMFFVGTEEQSKSQRFPGFPAQVCP